MFPHMGASALVNFSCNQATDAAEGYQQVSSGFVGDIARIFLRQGLVTGTSPTYRVSCQGISSAGVADGTIKAAGAAFVDITPVAGTDNTGYWVTLGTPWTPAAGEFFAIVIQHQSGTIDASNCCSFTTAATWTSGSAPGGPYIAIQNDNGTRTRSASGIPVFGYGAAATAHGFPIHAVGATNTVSPNEIGNKFALPAGWGATYRVLGVRLFSGAGTLGGTNTIKLYDTDLSTVIQSVTFDIDLVSNATNKAWYLYFDESTLADLVFGSTYRLTLSPDGAQQMNLAYFDVLNAADMDAYFLGQSCFSSSKSGGSFSDLTTRRYGIGPILADWTEPAGGGGGGSIFPGMVVR